MSHCEDLLQLQDIDIRIRDASRELKDIPARQSLEQDRLEEHRKQVAEAEESLKAKQAEIHQQQLESDARSEKISKLRQQQLQLKTNKEFKAMDSEIANVQGEISEIEDSELVLMEELESARAIVREKKAALEQEDAAVREDVTALDSRAAGIEEELAKFQAIREDAAAKIEKEWLTRYEIVMTRRDAALVKLTGGICGGCHMKLPPSVKHDSRKLPGKTSCPYCGRLVY